MVAQYRIDLDCCIAAAFEPNRIAAENYMVGPHLERNSATDSIEKIGVDRRSVALKRRVILEANRLQSCASANDRILRTRQPS